MPSADKCVLRSITWILFTLGKSALQHTKIFFPRGHRDLSDVGYIIYMN